MRVWRNNLRDTGLMRQLVPSFRRCPDSLVAGNWSIDTFRAAYMGGCNSESVTEGRSTRHSICMGDGGNICDSNRGLMRMEGPGWLEVVHVYYLSIFHLLETNFRMPLFLEQITGCYFLYFSMYQLKLKRNLEWDVSFNRFCCKRPKVSKLSHSRSESCCLNIIPIQNYRKKFAKPLLMSSIHDTKKGRSKCDIS